MEAATMNAILAPLDDAGLQAVLRPDGRVLIGPPGRLTDEVRLFIKDHLDQIVAELALRQASVAALAQLIDWPPPEPAWFARWMEEDDRRRAELMAAAKARLARR
jgi:hypothetical protein